MVVQGHIAQQVLFHILSAVEPVGLEHIGDTAIKPLHHAIGSRGSGLGQPVVYAQLLAQLVELVIAAGLPLSADKQVIRELLAVVGHYVRPTKYGMHL